MEGLSVFKEEKYEEIEKTEIEVVRYGDVELDKDEEAAMKLHPKMAIPKKLEEGFMDLALDIGYTKVRWQLRKDEEKGEDVGKDSKKEKEKEELMEMEEARTRTVYDSEKRIYDERKQKVTDLKECSRIYLPKPLEVVKEAQLEMRRELHSKISEEYRKEKCDDSQK